MGFISINIDEMTINSNASPARGVLCGNCFNMDLMNIVWSELGNGWEKESHLMTPWTIVNSKSDLESHLDETTYFIR